MKIDFRYLYLYVSFICEIIIFRLHCYATEVETLMLMLMDTSNGVVEILNSEIFTFQIDLIQMLLPELPE